MGRHIPISPELYRPTSALLLQEQLTQAILDHIDATGLRPGQITSQIMKKYPTFRLCYIREMRAGTLFGINRLLSICEALGIFPTFTLTHSQRQQAAMLEAA